MTAEEVDTLVKMIRSSAWIPLLSFVVGGIIRLCKSDAAVAWFRLTIRPERRAWYALGLAVVAGSVEQMAASSSGGWLNALVGGVVGGVVAGSGAIAAHELVVEGVRKGRDIGVKKIPPPPSTPPPDWAGDSLRPPPSTKTIIPTWPKLVAGIAVGLAISACLGARAAVCPVLDLASKACPFFLVKLDDGTTELVPRDRIFEATMRTRLLRMHVEAETARERVEIDARLDEEIRRLDGGTE